MVSVEESPSLLRQLLLARTNPHPTPPPPLWLYLFLLRVDLPFRAPSGQQTSMEMCLLLVLARHRVDPDLLCNPQTQIGPIFTSNPSPSPHPGTDCGQGPASQPHRGSGCAGRP